MKWTKLDRRVGDPVSACYRGRCMPHGSPVITVHGIRTRGVWQKDIATILQLHSMMALSYDYGRFNLLQFASGWCRQRQIERFHSFYNSIVARTDFEIDMDDPARRPSVIAHSFGSYIVGECLMKYEEVRLNKLILCGSILDPDFNWSLLFARDQVAEVRNDCGLQDVWVGLAGFLVPDAGPSGKKGFQYFGSLLKDEIGERLTHKDYFSRTQIEHSWVPFLAKPPTQLSIVHSRDIPGEELGQFLEAGRRIDSLCYGQIPGYSAVELQLRLAYQWAEINFDLWTFLKDRTTDGLVGYINAMPVTPDLARRILGGQVVDNEISADDVVPFLAVEEEPSPIYLMSIAALPEMRGHQRGLYPEPTERLINGLLSKLVYYALHKRFSFTHLISVAWTPPGRRLCQIFGMVETSKDRYGNPVYCASVSELETKRKIHPGLRKLVALYKSRGLMRRAPALDQDLQA